MLQTTLMNDNTSSYMCINGVYQNQAENILKLVLRPIMNFCSPGNHAPWIVALEPVVGWHVSLSQPIGSSSYRWVQTEPKCCRLVSFSEASQAALGFDLTIQCFAVARVQNQNYNIRPIVLCTNQLLRFGLHVPSCDLLWSLLFM